MSKKNLILLVCFILAITAVVTVVALKDKAYIPPTNFEECVQAGYPVLESYPRRCKAPDSEFVEDVGDEIEKQNLIQVFSPRPNASIKSPLTVTGQARGYWFFEASFPIHLFDGEGNKIATAIATAKEEWMTEDFVPFEATFTFDSVPTETGMLVFEKDNPSGLPENADQLRIPIQFERQDTPPGIAKECRPTGCSGQICADEDVASTCEWRQEYACYQTAKCERQTAGSCGWTQTSELTQCLSNIEQ